MQLPWPNVVAASIVANHAMEADGRDCYSWDEWRAVVKAALQDKFVPGFTRRIIARLKAYKDMGYTAEQVHASMSDPFFEVRDL